MSSTATTRHVRQPRTGTTGVIGAAVIGTALMTMIGIALMTSIRDDDAALKFNATAAQRIHLVREYDSATAHDPSGALPAHVLRENDAE